MLGAVLAQKVAFELQPPALEVEPHHFPLEAPLLDARGLGLALEGDFFAAEDDPVEFEDERGFEHQVVVGGELELLVAAHGRDVDSLAAAGPEREPRYPAGGAGAGGEARGAVAAAGGA